MQIFLSYAHDETSTALISRLKTQLRTSQIPAWVDFIDIKPGESWMASIDDAIRGSFALIIVLTPASSRSDYVTYEWSFALGAEIPVCPLLLQPASFHPRLKSIQWIDWSHDEKHGFSRLVEWLEPLVPYERKRVRDLAQELNRGNSEEKERALEQLVRIDSVDAQNLISELVSKAIDSLTVARSEVEAQEASRELLALDRAGVRDIHTRVHGLQQEKKLGEASSKAAQYVMSKTKAFNL
jgi:TIR domain